MSFDQDGNDTGKGSGDNAGPKGTPPGGLLPGPAPAPRRIPADLGDLLLVVLMVLLSIRLLHPILFDFFIASNPLQEPTPGAFLGLVLSSFLIESTVMVLAVEFIIRRKYDLTWYDLGFRPLANGWLQKGIIIGVISVPLFMLFMSVSQEFFGMPTENPQIDALTRVGTSWFAILSILLATAVVAPLAEEIVFRGVLFPWLHDRMGLQGAIFVSGLIFGLAHGIPHLIPPLTIFGMILAAVTHYSGTLWSAIIVHAVFNAIQIVSLFVLLSSGVQLT